MEENDDLTPRNDHLARELKKIEGVSSVNIKVDEIDQKTTSVFITIKGNDKLLLEEIEKSLDENNCSLHSVDNILIEDD